MRRYEVSTTTIEIRNQEFPFLQHVGLTASRCIAVVASAAAHVTVRVHWIRGM